MIQILDFHSLFPADPQQAKFPSSEETDSQSGVYCSSLVRNPVINTILPIKEECTNIVQIITTQDRKTKE